MVELGGLGGLKGVRWWGGGGGEDPPEQSQVNGHNNHWNSWYSCYVGQGINYKVLCPVASFGGGVIKNTVTLPAAPQLHRAVSSIIDTKDKRIKKYKYPICFFGIIILIFLNIFIFF